MALSPQELQLEALDSFKDSSNYLLVTTVAALGWVAKPPVNPAEAVWRNRSLWTFALSIVFGIFTLAAIPVVTEQVTTSAADRIYQTSGTFKPLWFLGWPEWPMVLKWVCWPQHVLFILGVLTYAVPATE